MDAPLSDGQAAAARAHPSGNPAVLNLPQGTPARAWTRYTGLNQASAGASSSAGPLAPGCIRDRANRLRHDAALARGQLPRKSADRGSGGTGARDESGHCSESAPRQ